jgi:chaperonin GroES
MTNGKKIRPLQGQALLYMDKAEAVSPGGIVIPEQAQERARFGEVRAVGIWRLNKKGNLISHPVKPGDRVLVRPASGRWMHAGDERLKIVDEDDILAVIEPET